MLLAARGNQLGHGIGNANTVVDDGTRLVGVKELMRGTSRHSLALAERLDRDAVGGLHVGTLAVLSLGASQFATQGWIERDVVARLLLRVNYDGIHPGRWNTDFARFQ